MARILFTTFEGGGHVPPPLLVAARLQALGHDVLVVSDPYNSAAASAKGLPFASWRRAPRRSVAAQASDPMDDWKSRWPPSVLRRLCSGVITGPSHAYALDVMEISGEFRPDIIVSNELLFGSIVAAERLGVPVALLTANLWCYPTRLDVPPFGPGFGKAETRTQHNRDAMTRSVIGKLFDVGLDDLNKTRTLVGLTELAHTLDQLDTVSDVILGVSSAFDFGNTDPPEKFVYAGPLFETPTWADDDVTFPYNGRPNVLISFSTTFQNQRSILIRCMKAAARLPINAIVTLGPAVERDGLPVASNLNVVDQASHDRIVPRCQAVLCHGGHGTVLRPLRHGVPVVAVPMGRDHADNGARLEWSGAGRRISERSSVSRIASALWAVATEPSYRNAARRMAAQLESSDQSVEQAADVILNRLAKASGVAPLQDIPERSYA